MGRSIGEELKQLKPEDKAQKAMAIEWLEAWKQRYPEHEGWSVDTAESRLSQCLRNQPAGIRFFLGEEARFETTCEVFRAGAEVRIRLKQQVEEMLAQERPIRLVLDVTSGPQTGAEVDAMFDALKARFLGEDACFPTALVLTERQYDRLPRSFDDFGDNLVVEKASDDEAARKLVDDHGQQGALVGTPHPWQPFERWMAIRVDNEFACEPPDALALFKASGSLPGLPEVSRPLERIVSEEKGSPLPTKDPLRLRTLMLKLAEGERVARADWEGRPHWNNDEVEPSRRLAWARQLGIQASATHEEWVTALPARIAPVPLLRSKTWLHLARWVARCTGAPAVFALSERIVAINPPEPVRAELAALSNVDIEEIPATGRSVLEALLQEATEMTEEERFDDPYLLALVNRYAKDETDKAALELVRQSLLASEMLPPCKMPQKKPAVADWRAAMVKLLEGTDPEARLLMRVVGHEEKPLPEVWFGPSGNVLPWNMVVRTECLIDRVRKWVVWEEGRHDSSVELLPIKGAPATWADQILEAARFELSPERTMRWYGPARTHAEPSIQLTSKRQPWREAPLEVSDSEWEHADRELAFLLSALRATIRNPDVLTLPCGKVLLPLGSGFFAEIHVWESAITHGRVPIASLVRAFSSDRSQNEIAVSSLTKFYPTYHARTTGYGRGITDIGVHLPRGLYLYGRGFQAEIVLRSSPLFMTSPPLPTLAGAAATAAHIDADEHRRLD